MVASIGNGCKSFFLKRFEQCTTEHRFDLVLKKIVAVRQKKWGCNQLIYTVIWIDDGCWDIFITGVEFMMMCVANERRDDVV